MTTEITQQIQPKTRSSLLTWLAGSAVIVVAASILTGCFVETARPRWVHRDYRDYHHRVVGWR